MVLLLFIIIANIIFFKVDVVPPVGSVVNFSDAEDLLNDLELM